MNLVENGFYIINDTFFKDFPDDYLKRNHGENRPHYYCFKAEDTGLYWVIPLSKRSYKYKPIIEKFEMKKRKPCDKLHIINIAGKESVFLIQDMFPITEEYISREYTIANLHLRILDQRQIDILNKKAKKIMNLIRLNIRFNHTQPDVLKIEKQLLIKKAEKEVAAIKEY